MQPGDRVDITNSDYQQALYGFRCILIMFRAMNLETSKFENKTATFKMNSPEANSDRPVSAMCMTLARWLVKNGYGAAENVRVIGVA